MPLTDTEALAARRGGRQRRGVRREPAVHPLGRGGDAAAARRPGGGASAWARTSCCRATSTTSASRCRRCCARTRRSARPRARASSASRWKPLIAQACSRAAGLRGSVIRAGDFFGAGTGSWLDQAIVKSIAARASWSTPARWTSPHAWAYLPDLARAFVAVAEQGGAGLSQRWHFAGHTLTGTELLAGAGAGRHRARHRAGARLPPRRHALGRDRAWSAGCVPMWRELARMSYLWRVPHALDGRRLRRAWPVVQPTPLPCWRCANRLRRARPGADESRYRARMTLPHGHRTPCSTSVTCASCCPPRAARSRRCAACRSRWHAARSSA